MGSTSNQRFSGIWDSLFPPENRIDLSSLDLLFNEGGVRLAVFDLAGDKAPGPDVIPVFFYQMFWQEVKSNFLWLMQEFANGTTSSGRKIFFQCET